MDSAAGIFRKGQELKTKAYTTLTALQYPQTSFYGFRWMKAWLDREERPINRKRLRRQMRIMTLRTILGGRRTSRRAPGTRPPTLLLSS